MIGVEAMRRWLVRLVERKQGNRPDNPQTVAVNKNVRGQESEILKLPIDASNWEPLQSPGTGEFYFTADYDSADGAFSPLL